MVKQALGDRMKENYEKPWNIQLPARLPVIIRIDGKNFHAFTRKLDRPFDRDFMEAMNLLGIYLCSEVATCQMAYIQSDEISLLLHPYKKLSSQAWFVNEVQKIVSVTAGMASAWFTSYWNTIPRSSLTPKQAIFDARVFVLPESEVVNYFIWRQKDMERNSMQLFARSLFSHKQVHGKNGSELQDMMMGTGLNWNDQSVPQKRGTCIVKKEGGWQVDSNIPIFTTNREYINQYLTVEEE